MLLKVGDRLGPYEIRAQIGAGGMGEVYRARDSRLGRDVAIKKTCATTVVARDFDPASALVAQDFSPASASERQ